MQIKTKHRLKKKVWPFSFSDENQGLLRGCMVHDFIPKQRISFALHARTASTRWLGVASHGLACPASCLIPSLAFKKLSPAAKRAFLLVGLWKTEQTGGGDGVKREMKQHVVLISLPYTATIYLHLFPHFFSWPRRWPCEWSSNDRLWLSLCMTETHGRVLDLCRQDDFTGRLWRKPTTYLRMLARFCMGAASKWQAS